MRTSPSCPRVHAQNHRRYPSPGDKGRPKRSRPPVYTDSGYVAVRARAYRVRVKPLIAHHKAWSGAFPHRVTWCPDAILDRVAGSCSGEERVVTVTQQLTCSLMVQ
ncbi:unnamed protein product [Merluccius merluccius]